MKMANKQDYYQKILRSAALSTTKVTGIVILEGSTMYRDLPDLDLRKKQAVD